jgi:hypothetical protein
MMRMRAKKAATNVARIAGTAMLVKRSCQAEEAGNEVDRCHVSWGSREIRPRSGNADPPSLAARPIVHGGSHSARHYPC